MAMGDNRTKLGAAVVVMVALTVYALTLAPGLTWAHDGADGAIWPSPWQISASPTLRAIPLT